MDHDLMNDDFGENIWDISSWNTDVHWKDAHLHRYFDSLPFNECIKEIIDLAEAYFQSVYNAYGDEEEGAEPDFPYLDIIVLITEEYLYGHFFSTFTPLQELHMLETLCSYFEENKLDPVRYFVFDCLFGIPNENIELQKGLMEHKMNIMSKLTSMAIGLGCGHMLNCIAVWLHTYGSQFSRACKIAYYIVNDYCFICPKAIKVVNDLIDVSPVFAHQFVIALSQYNGYDNSDQESSRVILPPFLVNIIASWIIEQPNFCMVKIPRVFLELPSVHKFAVSSEQSLFNSCPLFACIQWCLLEPLVRKQFADQENAVTAYSILHYGLLNYMSLQRKVETLPTENSDDLEPGELLEENDSVELISKPDITYLVTKLLKMLEKHLDEREARKEESTDRLVQFLQVAKWTGCLSVRFKTLRPLLITLPKTRLLKQILSYNT